MSKGYYSKYGIPFDDYEIIDDEAGDKLDWEECKKSNNKKAKIDSPY